MFTTDVSTDIGKVRLLITDMDSDRPIFPDDDYIQAFLDLELDDVKNAAALALETIASNRAMVLQVIQILDLKLDGSKTAEGLRKAAEVLRETSDNDWDGFDIADQVSDNDFTYREFILKQLIAGVE